MPFTPKVSDEQVADAIASTDTVAAAAASLNVTTRTIMRRRKRLAAEPNPDVQPAPKRRDRAAERARRANAHRQPEHERKPSTKAPPAMREPVVTRSKRHPGSVGDYSFQGAGAEGERGAFGYGPSRRAQPVDAVALEHAGRVRVAKGPRVFLVDPEDAERYREQGWKVSGG